MFVGNRPRVLVGHVLRRHQTTTTTTTTSALGSKSHEGIPAAWLRDACPCSSCVHPSTKQKLFSIGGLASSTRARARASVLATEKEKNSNQITLSFSGDSGSVVPPDHLASFDHSFIELAKTRFAQNKAAHQPSVLRTVTWEACQFDRVRSERGDLDYARLVESDKDKNEHELLKLLTQLQEHGLAFIKNIPTDEADDPAKLPQLETIIKAMGCVVRESFYGRTWDVKSVKNAKNIAYTSLDLGLHMDLLYFESPPGIQFLHSLKNTVTGGESIFLDSYHAALTLKRESPHHYKTLCETPITFHYDNDSHLMKQHRYTISENNLNSEAPFGLRVFYSPPFQGPLDKVTSVEQMENLVEAMRAFEDIMRRPGMVYRTRLEPGTAVVFRNLRVLHGRTEFDAQSGERHFKGSYVDYDVVSDRFLFLARKAGLISDTRKQHSNEKGTPTQHIVLQGLPPSANDQSVHAGLESLGACLETVRVVLDKGSGLAKGFAFVKFISTQHARVFMDAHFPFVSICGGNRVRLEYSKATATVDDDWVCSNCGITNFRHRVMCFQCKLSKDAAVVKPEPLQIEVNDGRKDVGTIPCNLLVALNLDILTTEETFHASLAQYQTPITQVRLVKDRQTHQSYGFGFIEFADIPTATAFLAQTYTLGGLHIDNRAITLAFANTGSFVQVFERSEWVTSFYQTDANGICYLRYWDEAAYATAFPSFMGILDELETAAAAAAAGGGGGGGGGKQMEGGGLAGGESFASIDDELAAFMEEVGEVQVGGEEIVEVSKQVSSEKDALESEEKMGLGVVAVAAPVVVAPATAVRGDYVEDEMQYYQGRRSSDELQQERAGEERQELELSEYDRAQMNPARLAMLSDEPIPDTYMETDEAYPEPEEEPTMEPIDLSDDALLQRLPSIDEINREKSDLSLMACLLCERQFKGIDELTKHQVKSGLHKTNLQALRELQISDLRASLLAQIAQQEEASMKQSNTQYRNRAAERRKMYGQPSKVPSERHAPYPTSSSSSSKSRMYAPGQGYGTERAFPIVPVQPTVNGIGDDNIGNKMLKAMGWKEGSGLGAKRDGIVAPIAPDGYAKGVGLGNK
ncbi:hypothetical protein HDU79_004746 [Rhizoclosmatium sp. JEL0117]|nr:hypothetical protein HDU79_004746 [Rhizoclosmatium sp. JEL0117]